MCLPINRHGLAKPQTMKMELDHHVYPSQKPEDLEWTPKKVRRTRKPLSSSVIIHHDYHDHANDPEGLKDDGDGDEEEFHPTVARGGVTNPFPVKLFRMLAAIDEEIEVADSGDSPSSSIISWQPHGRCFVVRKPGEFTKEILPKFMGLTKLASFQRQLNLYGFRRITQGRDRGGYYHELFLRNRFGLVHSMVRAKIKGTGVRGRSNPDQEPDFWTMEWVSPKTPSTVSPVAAASTTSIGMEREGILISPTSTPSASPKPQASVAKSGSENSIFTSGFESSAEMLSLLDESKTVLSNSLADFNAIFELPVMDHTRSTQSIQDDSHRRPQQVMSADTTIGIGDLPGFGAASSAVDDAIFNDNVELEILQQFFFDDANANINYAV